MVFCHGLKYLKLILYQLMIQNLNHFTGMKLEFPQVIHNLCAYYKYFEYGLFGTSILHLTAITINRYISICHRGFYSKIYSSRNVYIMICIMWLFSFGFVLLPLFGVWGQIGKLKQFWRSPNIFGLQQIFSDIDQRAKFCI